MDRVQNQALWIASLGAAPGTSDETLNTILASTIYQLERYKL